MSITRSLVVAIALAAAAPACLKNDATHDPIEPVMMALTNSTDHVVYLDMTPGGDILGGGLRLQHSGQNDFIIPTPSCKQRLCSDACAVSACANGSAVREILPRQTYTLEWVPYEFTAGQDPCPGQACVQPGRAPDGRYLMSACYGTEITVSGTPQKSSTDPLVIEGAQVTALTCTKTFDIGLPGYDVRYQLYIP